MKPKELSKKEEAKQKNEENDEENEQIMKDPEDEKTKRGRGNLR